MNAATFGPLDRRSFTSAFRPRRRTPLLAVLATVLLAAGCGGSDGDSAGDGQGGAVAAAQLLGTFATGLAVEGDVQALSSDGVLLVSRSAGDGTFSIAVTGGTAPFLLRGTLPDGTHLYSVATATPSASDSVTVNVTPLTDLIVAALAPQGQPALLWSMAAPERVAALQAATVQQSRDQVTALVAPVAAQLGIPTSTDLLSTPFRADGHGQDALLDAVEVRAIPSATATLFAVNAKAAPGRPAVWTSGGAFAELDLGVKAAFVDIGATHAAARDSYAALSQAAAGFDPDKLDTARLQSVVGQMPQLDFFDPGWEAAFERWYSQFLEALGMPAALVSRIMRLLNDGSDEGIELLLGFLGAEADQVVADAKNLTAVPVSVDASQGIVTYRITMGSQQWYQDWTVNGNKPASQRLLQPQHNQCMRSRYVGSFNGFAISAESFIRDSEYYNACSFPVEFVTCVWRAGNIGPQASGCATGVSSGSAQPQAGTTHRDVVSGPLNEERTFAVCAAPYKPVRTTDNASSQQGFRQAYRCALS